jgi:hypothetical protein
MAKRIRVNIEASGAEGKIYFGCDVSEKSKLSLADWLWFAKGKYKETFKRFPEELKVVYL